MYKSKTIFFTYNIILLLSLLSGCTKEKTQIHKQSFLSKAQKAKDTASIKAFDLDHNDMTTFALDQNQSQRSQTTTNQQQSNLFSWENLAAENTKQEFKKLIFNFDRYTLEQNQQKELKHNIKQAKKMIKDGKTIVIEGHACHSAGSAIYNLALSEKRARHVAKKLADAGIDPTRIKIAPRGHEMPIVKNGNREEQAINRRVELFAIDN